MTDTDFLSKALSDGIGYPFCVFDLAETVVTCNTEFENVLGANRSKATPLEKIFAATELAPLIQGIRQGLKGMIPELPIVSIGDPARQYQVVVKPIFRDGKVLFAVITLADVTKQVSSLQFANKAREFYNHVFDEMPQAYFLVNEDFTVLMANRVAHELFGYPPFGLPGLALPGLIHMAEDNAVVQMFAAYRTAGENTLKIGETEQVSGIRRDGTHFPGRVSLMRSDLTGILTYSVIFTDLSEDQRRGQENIEEEKKLQTMMRNEALGNLAGKFAHDMNNILAVIGGFAELLSLSPRDQDIESISEITHAVKRAANLTTRILAYTGRQQIGRRVEDLKILLSERSSLWRDVLGDKIKLKLELSEDNITTLVDEKLFVQIMLNLLSNCREAIQESGNVTLSVATISPSAGFFKERGIHAAAGTFAEIRVTDDGSGIPAESMPSIFEPYYSTKDPNKSSGLGLAIVRGVVKQHDGFIFCDSAVGKGTTMLMLLPLTDREVTVETAKEISAEIHPPDFKVLIAEDEDQILRILESSLRDAGFQIVTAVNGRVALDWLEACEGKIDLLISDVMMPEVSGIALGQRALELFPQLPIIFITGYSSQVLDTHSVLRAFPVIHKPFSPRAVVAAAMLEIAKAVTSRNRTDYTAPE
jgi:two-component system, cell cycle sensor histidine kinase and response regulator CckA